MLLEKKSHGFVFKFKKFSIKEAIFIIEIISIHVKVHTQNFFLNFLLVEAFFFKI